MSRILLEVCVDDAAGLRAAVQGGANRIELCAALAFGGLTPSVGLMAWAADQGLPVMAMIRPRAGDFIWDNDEIRIQCHEIRAARAAGLAGVVIGASLPDGRLDLVALQALMGEAMGLDVTLHRAIDLTPDPAEAMALCADLGIGRVLTSGGAQAAGQGVSRLQAMAKAAPGVVVMPGGGISAENVAGLAGALPLAEVHASCATPLPANPLMQAFGFQAPGARGTDAARVAALRAALDQIAASRPSG